MQADQTTLTCEMIGKLFTAQYKVFNRDIHNCITNDINEELSKNFKHVSHEVHLLKEPHPEVFMINMNYSNWANGMGNPQDIMTLLLAIPENFEPTNLFNASLQKN